MYSANQALARFGAVSVVEIIALSLCFLPLIGTAHEWQKDCLIIGLWTIGTILFLCFLVFLINAFSQPEMKVKKNMSKYTDFGIIAIYCINILCLSLVVVRTGGPFLSLYAPLIPIQLSAILFLQIDYDRDKNKISKIVFLYCALAIFALLFKYLFPNIFSTIEISRIEKQLFFLKTNANWNITLTITGMILALLTYWLQYGNRFGNFLSKYVSN